ncbi:uncharacterized protein LOC123562764 [Mercenaria mercenaria]|uniref:uncharacterized protein LOC123562764 n=1 Tax=Mercenaria mercenaria TaxID=6596 RepID=UPI00234EEE47|nr:uncharacterized protein LOC123562764 [Mercenaria mercenaria]
MCTFWIKYLFGTLCLIDLSVRVNSLQCFELSCNGTNCLHTEIVNNPLLINKCNRVIYKGCYTVTTTFSGFSLTTAGCVDMKFECSSGTCSGTFVRTEVSCCNTDLCNDGKISSAARVTLGTWTCFFLCNFIHILMSTFSKPN